MMMLEIYIPLPQKPTCFLLENKHIIVLFFSRKDVSDGHTTDGFFDGSGRSRHPEGKELKVPRGKGDGNQLPSQQPTKHLFKELGR